MAASLRSTWALLLGIALIMLGSGLQSTLLGVRAGLEDFPTAMTGLIMSAYFAGFLAGSVAAPRLLQQVGHVRVFAALASLASTAVLVHAVVVEPWTWIAMRLMTGLCSAGLYVVAESWLNDRATNETRGQLLATYMVIVLGGVGGGQFLLNLADPSGFELFVGASILISLALIPILLTATPAPDFTSPATIGLRQLYRVSPLGVIGCFGIGIAQSGLWGMSAVYAESIGFSIAEITFYGGALFLGAIVFQFPLGRLSDRFDRRQVITGVAFVAFAASITAVFIGEFSIWHSLAVIFVIGGMCMPAYSLCVAHTNDFLQPAQMVAASASLYFVYGVGASFGPFATAGVMSLYGPPGFYLSLAAACGAVFLFALYRMTRRAAVPLEEQNPSVIVPAQASPVFTELAAEMLHEEAEEATDGTS